MAGPHRRRSAVKSYSRKDAYPAKRRTENEAEKDEGGMSTSILLAILSLSAVLGLAWLFWAYTRPTPTRPAGTANSSVYARGLVTADVNYQSVILEHSRYWKNVSHSHFQSPVLAYVTPWNGKGYDMAKTFRSKFTHVSPVWYQLKRSNEGLNLYGRHDVDEQWINDVRQKGSPLIVPRVVLEGWPLDILMKKEESEKAVSILTNEILEMQFDGIVLEAWSLWRVHRILEDPNLRKKALEFVKLLGLELHTMKGFHLYSASSPQLIFVIPPPGKPGDPTLFTMSDMIYLRDAVDGFSLMTYDFSSPYSPGPNAPLAWIRQCLQILLPGRPKEVARDAQKVLMGINFYGNDFSTPQGGGPIVSHEYLLLLAQYKPQIFWDEGSQEHRFEYVKDERQNRKNMVYYPSLMSLSLRLKEAKAWGVGISIWEIGQGLDYFFDLL